jgi:hypothetical protein
MDALSSAVGLKVDFDMALLVVASGLYRLLATRMRGHGDAVELLRRSATRSARGMMAAYGRLTDHGRNGGTEFIREFGDTSVPAFESYVQQMARTGDIGRWMRTLLPAHRARIAGHRVLFMHADLPEKYRDEKVLEHHLRWIEEHMKASSISLGGTRARWANFHLAEIFWERTFGELANASPGHLAGLCRKVGVDFIVTGQTPHDSITVYGNESSILTWACAETTYQRRW